MIQTKARIACDVYGCPHVSVTFETPSRAVQGVLSQGWRRVRPFEGAEDIFLCPPHAQAAQPDWPDGATVEPPW